MTPSCMLVLYVFISIHDIHKYFIAKFRNITGIVPMITLWNTELLEHLWIIKGWNSVKVSNSTRRCAVYKALNLEVQSIMTPTATWTFNENIIMTIITDREQMSVKRRNLRKYPIFSIYKNLQMVTSNTCTNKLSA